jgi:anti-sigma factor RsiW
MTPGDHEDREELAVDRDELDLLAYLDGELDDARAAEIEARIARDRAFAGRMRAFEAMSDFLRRDADRIFAQAKVDAIVDDVLAKVRTGRSLELVTPPPASILPPTSRLSRSRKNTVIWVSFGAVAAAAAGLFLYVGGHRAGGPNPVASQAAPAETVAVAPPKVREPVAEGPTESARVEVEQLEVGEGATVIYGRGDDGSSPVVWITEREGVK